MLTRIRTEQSPTISILTTISRPTMAEETNVAISDPTVSGAEMEHSQHDNGAEAAHKVMDEGTSEPVKEGAEQEEAVEGKYKPQ